MCREMEGHLKKRIKSVTWISLLEFYCSTDIFVWRGVALPILKKGALGARSPKGAKDSITLEIRYTSLLFNTIFFELMPLRSRHVWASDYKKSVLLFYLKSSREPFLWKVKRFQLWRPPTFLLTAWLLLYRFFNDSSLIKHPNVLYPFLTFLLP